MTGDDTSNETTQTRPATAPRGEPLPPDRSKDLPELPDPAEVGEDG